MAALLEHEVSLQATVASWSPSSLFLALDCWDGFKNLRDEVQVGSLEGAHTQTSFHVANPKFTPCSHHR